MASSKTSFFFASGQSRPHGNSGCAGMRRFRPNRLGALAGTWLTFAAVVGATFALHEQIPQTSSATEASTFIPAPEIASLSALGFDAAVSDYYWLRAVQLVGGDSLLTPEKAEEIGRLIDLVTTLNPHVDHPYRFAAVWMTGSESLVRDANRLLERGVRYHSDDWRNLFYLGFNHFYYLAENDEAARILHRASQIHGSPRYLPRLVARLRSEAGSLEVAEVFLLELTGAAHDELERRSYLSALDEIEIEKKARMLDRARESFRKIHGRDIRFVGELVSVSPARLEQLPNPEPESLPSSLTQNSHWGIHSQSDVIVSSYYGRRYGLNFASEEKIRVQSRRSREGKREVDGRPTASSQSNRDEKNAALS